MGARIDRLFRAVVEAPDDDAPRLAYADAMDARDDPRGRFIRLELDVHRRRRAPRDQTLAARKEAVALLDVHRERWLGSLALLLARGVIARASFYRGFVERVRMDAGQFIERGAEVVAAAPIRHLELRDVGARAPRVFASPALERIASLGLAKNALGDEGVLALAASQRLSRLAHLDLFGNEIGPAGVEALVASDRLPALRYVNLAGNPGPDPHDLFGLDEIDGRVVPGSIYPSELGDALAARHGDRPWLHSALPGGRWPPSIDDI